MDRVRFLDHKGKQLLVIDFSDCSPTAVLRTIEMAKSFIKQQSEGSLLTLTVATNARFDFEVVRALKDYTSQNKRYVRAAAVVGIGGLQKIILNTVVRFTGRTFGLFDDFKKASDWLIEQS